MSFSVKFGTAGQLTQISAVAHDSKSSVDSVDLIWNNVKIVFGIWYPIKE